FDQSKLPQTQPCDEAGKLDKGETEKRRIFMFADQVLRYVIAGLEYFLRCTAAHVRGNGYRCDQKENDEAGLLQVFVLSNQPDEQESECYGKTDGRKMIQ